MFSFSVEESDHFSSLHRWEIIDHQCCGSNISLVLVLCISAASDVLQLQIKPACVGIFTKGIPVKRLFIYLHLHHNAHLGVFCVLLHYYTTSTGAVLQSATVAGKM